MKTDLSVKFLSATERHAMIPRGSAVLCGVSGGADSVALLHLLTQHRAQLGIADLTACHINHCLRGDESDRDETFVRDLCHHLDIPLVVHREDAAALAAREGLSVEAGARALRYRVFDAYCPGNGRIATAHTLSDSIETALLNLFRGTGPRGLTGIPPVRGHVVRPLIDCTRAEVEAYLQERDIAYVTDSTNLSNDYTRNRIRHKIIPQIKAINPQFEAVFARNFSIMAQEVDTLDRLTAAELEKAAAHGGYSCAALLASPIEATRLIYQLARDRSLYLDHHLCGHCAELLGRPSGSIQLPDGFIFYVHGGQAYLYRPSDYPVPDPVVIHVSDLKERSLTVPFGTVKLTLSYFDKGGGETGDLFTKKGLKNLLDYDKMDDILLLRVATMGDKLMQPGRGAHKTVKKLLSEARVPRHVRHMVPLLESAGTTAFIAGFGCDQSAVASDGTKCYISVSIEQFTRT